MPIARMWRVALVLGAATVGACASPAQQLLLPSPLPPAARVPGKEGGAPLASISEKRWANEAVGTDGLTGRGVPRAAVRGTKDGVSLNLVEASIPEAAKAILGDALGVTYSVSEKVKGTITLQTAAAVPREALLEVFEDALRTEGAAIALRQGTYRILPSGEAVAAAPLRGAGAKYRHMPGVSTHVVPLRYVAASEMGRILKEIAPNTNLLRTDTARNLLVVSGTRAELDAVMDAVGVFDVDWMRGMSFGIYPLESADPEAVAQELDTVFANDRDGPGKGIVRFIPNQRLKSVLVISSRAEHLRRARAWIRRLDTATQATVKQVFVYPVRSRTASELAQLLRRVYGSQEQVRTPPSAPVSPPSPIELSTTMSAPGALPSASRSVVEQPAPQPEPDTAAEPPAAPAAAPPANGARDDRHADISIIEDEPNNALVITATAREYKRVRQILERLDVAPKQVLLEATIAEVGLSDELKMGVRWFFRAGNSDLKFSDVETGAISSVFPGFSHFLNAANIQVVFNALSSITDVNIISSPTLMVLDNKKATLQVGDEVPIVTQSAVAVGTTDAPVVNSVSYRNTGIVLNITPRIGDQGRVLLEVEQEASEVVKTSVSGIDSPTIQQRRVKTTVAVNDGESIILGGLIQDRADNARSQLPLLGELPVLGNLFKSKSDQVARTELLVAITPRVVRDAGGQTRSITEEFRSRINLTARPHRQWPPDHKEQVNRVLR